VYSLLFFCPIQQHIYKCTNFFKSISRVSSYRPLFTHCVLCASTCVVVSFFFVMCIEGRKKIKLHKKKKKILLCASVSHSLLSMYTHFFRLFGSLISFVVVVAAASNFFMYFLLLPPTLKKPKFQKIFFHATIFCVVGCKSESSPGSLCSFFYILFSYFLIFFLLLFFYEQKKIERTFN